MRDRGDTAQIQRAEETLEKLDEINEKLVCFSKIVILFSLFNVHILLYLSLSNTIFFTISYLQNLLFDHLKIPKTLKMGERID